MFKKYTIDYEIFVESFKTELLWNTLIFKIYKDQTNINVVDYLNLIEGYGVSRIIYTDIEKDGTNLGPNYDDSYEIANNFKIPLVVSGGVSSIKDINKIINENKKIEGIVVGKAIYEKRISLADLSKIK